MKKEDDQKYTTPGADVNALFSEIHSQLCAPFPEGDIEWRIGRTNVTRGGRVRAKCLAYITNRAIQQRLDDVVGCQNWQSRFEITDKGVLAEIGIFFVGRAWVWKGDGAEFTQIEAFKGGISGAMKRAGAQWGIGRYLYKLTENDARIDERNGRFFIKVKDPSFDGGEKWFKWSPPPLPAWALPKEQVSDLGKALSEAEYVDHSGGKTLDDKGHLVDDQRESDALQF